MYAGDETRKFLWLCDRVEAVGRVRCEGGGAGGSPPDGTEVGGGDSFDLDLDDGYKHLSALLPANNPMWFYRRGQVPAVPMLHCETLPLDGGDGINRTDPWWGPPQKGEGVPFMVTDPSDPEHPRPLRVGDHVRVIGRWVLDHHPEYYFSQNGIPTPIASASGLIGLEFIGLNLIQLPVLLHVGYAHAELHPFDWQNITLVRNPSPRQTRTTIITVAAPLHEQVFVGANKYASNGTAGVGSRSAIENSQSNWHGTVDFTVPITAPPLPPPFRGDAGLVYSSRSDLIATSATNFQIETRADGIVVFGTVFAPTTAAARPIAPGAIGLPMAIGSIFGPAGNVSVFQSEFFVGWLPRLVCVDSRDRPLETIQFPPTAVGVAEAMRIRVINRGPDPITLESIRVTAEFLDAVNDISVFVVPTSTATLAAGEVLEFPGQFIPTEALVYRASLMIESNDPAHPRVWTPLSGAAASAPPSGELDVSVNPRPRIGRMELTVAAVDRLTRSPVAGKVMIVNPLASEVEAGASNVPFAFEFTSRRVWVSDFEPRQDSGGQRPGRGGHWEFLLPTGRITGLPAPYRDAWIPLFD